jgi:inhibitor of KinA
MKYNSKVKSVSSKLHPVEYPFSYRIFPLGDSALTLDFGNTINDAINREVLALFRQINQKPFRGIIELLPAYSSLTVFYDTVTLRPSLPENTTAYDWMRMQLENFLVTTVTSGDETNREVRIPVCYHKDFAPDLQRVADLKNLSFDDIIRLHTGKKYRVFMLGFLPGFPYLGKTDKKINVARKDEPEKVKAGSVGIAGRQTGIYPFNSPGGWQIIGKTPVKLFDKEKTEITLLKPGDVVEFFSISKEEFLKLSDEPENN